MKFRQGFVSNSSSSAFLLDESRCRSEADKAFVIAVKTTPQNDLGRSTSHVKEEDLYTYVGRCYGGYFSPELGLMIDTNKRQCGKPLFYIRSDEDDLGFEIGYPPEHLIVAEMEWH